jgi:murein DD-endopeptidase MepM/ murein hydrolase activator NlpD
MFGVGRDHDSPESCGAGHCGVDVGEVKGEPVLAVHDGVVERVVREPTETDRGGKYVRLVHYGGRIVTQYMHLDEVEPELKPGYHVKAGEKIGTVGDSGTHNSGPHLHFTFATRASDGAPEVYVDPLALLTVWPLK